MSEVIGKSSVELSDVCSPMSIEANNFDQSATEIASTALINSVKAEIVGPPIEGWKKVFYVSDPFLAEQYVRDTRPFNNFNILFNILFRGAVLAFWIIFTIAYFNAESSTSYSMTPAESMIPIRISISLNCTTELGCYTYNTSSNHVTTPITVVGLYDQVNPKYCPYSNFNETVTSLYANTTLSVVLCFSTLYSDGVFLNIPFQSNSVVNNNIKVTITAPEYDNSLNFVMQLVPTQEKMIYLSQIGSSKQGIVCRFPLCCL